MIFRYTILYVQDVGRSLSFYEQALGGSNAGSCMTAAIMVNLSPARPSWPFPHVR